MDLKNNTIEIVERIGSTPDKLIEILIEAQLLNEEHYITEEQLKIISEELKISFSKVYGIASFYSMLSTKKKGKYVIQICNSGPCYINKAKNVVEAFEKNLGIHIGEITTDGLFSMEYISCFGACQIAPAVKINEKIHGNLDENKVKQLVETLKKEAI